MGRISYLHQLLVKREISATELTKAYLDAISRDNGSLGALVSVTEKEALSAAQQADKAFAAGEETSVLCGIPMALKDNISTKGIETTCCSKMLLGYKPVYDATVWHRLRLHGAVLLGKANMDEFAMGSSCEASCFGPAKNPFDTAMSTGGSSGGSAGAVAANLAVYTLGSDTGGSIRQPAAFCGITGLKPTYGSISRSGLVAFASSLDQIGPMAMTAEDVSVVFDAIAGWDPLDGTSNRNYRPDTYQSLNNDIKGKTLAVVREFSQDVSEEVTVAVDKAVKTYEAMGVNIIYLDIPRVEYALPAYYVLACAEASSNLARYDGVRYGHKTELSCQSISEMMVKSRSEAFGEVVKRRILLGTYVLSQGSYDTYYKKAQTIRKILADKFEKVFEKCDGIIAPTTPTPAFKIGRTDHNPMQEEKADICTVPANIAGIPAVTMCCGYSQSGLPLGVQIIGRKFREDTILNFAHKFQQATDFVPATDWGVKL